MKNRSEMMYWVCLSLLASGLAQGQNVVINEIMYHPLQPAFGAEPLGQEFVELYNRSATNVNLNGWHFNKGITFTFTNVSLAPGAYIVVAANLAEFAAAHPGVANVVGP